jgi:carboxypeptidase Q
MKRIYFLLLLIPLYGNGQQVKDSTTIRKIYSYALTKGEGYNWLRDLCALGPRLSGSTGAEKAVAWAKSQLEKNSNGNVWLQEVMVPHWVRGKTELLQTISKGKKTPLRICALGGSIGTSSKGLKAKVIEVKSYEELESLGIQNISGKIVFFNTPMNPEYISTFNAYGEKGTFRYSGAKNAIKYGAVGTITRSLTLSLDDHPHTGAMGYGDTTVRIPACAISTKGAEALSLMINNDPELEVEIKMDCAILPDVLSYNVIAEIRGSEFPDEIILVGGHLDAWDNSVGAHDDGAGCVQSMEILKIFRELNIQPKRTVRVVLFMNEENGLKGGKKYAAEALAKKEKHIAAIESDAGGFTPHGFVTEGNSEHREIVLSWKSLFEPYGLYNWKGVGGGADIGPLKEQGTLLIGLSPDSQRYFDYHHSEIDTFDKVNRRELLLGTASMASLVYLLSEYGLEKK